jgi:hypothetical protein
VCQAPSRSSRVHQVLPPFGVQNPRFTYLASRLSSPLRSVSPQHSLANPSIEVVSSGCSKRVQDPGTEVLRCECRSQVVYTPQLKN